MAEKLPIPQPEDNKSLSKAVEDIVLLTDWSIQGMYNKGGVIDKLWQNKTIVNPDYPDKINELRKVTKVAESKRKKYSDRDLETYLHLFLEKVAEEGAIPLLSDIWCYRVPMVYNPKRFSETLMTTGLA
jgi:hypothetical protein